MPAEKDSVLPEPLIQIKDFDELFVGIPNFVRVTVPGVKQESLQITATGATVRKHDDTDRYRYTVQPDSLGKVVLTVSAPGREPYTQDYKAVPLPVVARFGARHDSKEMGNGEFRAQGGVTVGLDYSKLSLCSEVFHCDMITFEVLRCTQDGQLTVVQNQGARWNPPVQEVIQAARPGDLYLFRKIKGRCFGKEEPQEVPPLVFTIR